MSNSLRYKASGYRLIDSFDTVTQPQELLLTKVSSHAICEELAKHRTQSGMLSLSARRRRRATSFGRGGADVIIGRPLRGCLIPDFSAADWSADRAEYPQHHTNHNQDCADGVENREACEVTDQQKDD